MTSDKIYEDRKNQLLVEELKNKSYNFELAEEKLRKADVEIVEEYSYR